MTLIKWSDIREKVYEKQPFLIEPYIPRGGIVFLYGGTSQGKSPTSWCMAKAIATGTSFFGLPTEKGRVLYIDVDSPERVAAERLRTEPNPPDDVFFSFQPPLSLDSLGGTEMQELLTIRDEVKPDVVFINTLRKIHDLDDKDSKAPKIVYGRLQQIFPGTALVVIHHPRKMPTQKGVTTARSEGHSGSQAWVNDAQVGLKLERFRNASWDPRLFQSVRLYHIKSQASALYRPLPLLLDRADGYTLSCPLYDEFLTTYLMMGSLDGATKKEVDAEVGKKLGISESTAKRRRLSIENGLFPDTSAWLGRDDGKSDGLPDEVVDGEE